MGARHVVQIETDPDQRCPGKHLLRVATTQTKNAVIRAFPTSRCDAISCNLSGSTTLVHHWDTKFAKNLRYLGLHIVKHRLYTLLPRGLTMAHPH